MKVYKQKQYLVFDLDDGKTVKYDFANKVAIGKSGKVVKDLKTQLSRKTLNDIFYNCEDQNYAKFLQFVRDSVSCEHGCSITNIGTILSHVPEYSYLEQFFSAGVKISLSRTLSYDINHIPKGLLKICRKYDIPLYDNLIRVYKEMPDAYNVVFSMNFISLDERDIRTLFTYINSFLGECESMYNKAISDYGYTPKGLLNYLDYCKTYEALEDIRNVLHTLVDYAYMMRKISPKFDKYPRHLLTTHRIAIRNYERLEQEFDEVAFEKRINSSMEMTFGNYKFYYPRSTQAIKDEAVMQNNCVASYIQRVIDGKCDILFLRYKDLPDKSLVTIEVRNNQIVQAYQKFNDPVTELQQDAIDKWNEWYGKKMMDMAS